MIGLIAAVDQNDLIGYDGTIPWHKPADLKRFKEVTTNNVIIMGRKTFNSIGKCLPNRINIVITSEPDNITKCDPLPQCYSSLADAIEGTKAYNKDIWIIGGEQIYAMAMNFVDVIDLTVVEFDYVVKDKSKAVYFPIIPDEFDLRVASINPDDNYLSHYRYIRRNEKEEQASTA